MTLLWRLCDWIAKSCNSRIIVARARDDIYMIRYYLLGGPRDWERGEEKKVSVLPWNLYLHHFLRSDDSRTLHNHPSKWGLSIILTGGYSEERRGAPCGHCIYCKNSKKRGENCPYRVYRRVKRPFSINLIRANDYHRVDLLGEDCWTLFLAGPKTQSWGFWERSSGKFTPWEKYVEP